jgi:hypothetical protein
LEEDKNKMVAVQKIMKEIVGKLKNDEQQNIVKNLIVFLLKFNEAFCSSKESFFST